MNEFKVKRPRAESRKRKAGERRCLQLMKTDLTTSHRTKATKTRNQKSPITNKPLDQFLHRLLRSCCCHSILAKLAVLNRSRFARIRPRFACNLSSKQKATVVTM